MTTLLLNLYESVAVAVKILFLNERLTPSKIGLWSLGAVQNTVSLITSLKIFVSNLKLLSLEITGNSGYSSGSYPLILN